MNWQDEGIVLSVRPHGETAAVVELFTRAHGRHTGLVHGGRSRKSRPVLQTGNHVDASWKGRLSEHLGHMTLELRTGFAAAAMESPMALAGLASMASLARLLPERDPHPSLYEITLFVLGFLDDPSVWPALLVRWELGLLDELGFGLDLTRCAVTGSGEALAYVSPRTGRAVSAAAGAPYRDRLLPLPTFLLQPTSAVATDALIDGFRLTGHFLARHVFEPRGIPAPDARDRVLRGIAQRRH